MVALSDPKKDAQICEVCKTKEGTERPIGRVLVELKEVEIESKILTLCQVCHKNKINLMNQKNRTKKSSGNKWIDKLRNIGFF